MKFDGILPNYPSGTKELHEIAAASYSSHLNAECHEESKKSEEKRGGLQEGGHVIPSFLIDNSEEFHQTSLTGKFV